MTTSRPKRRPVHCIDWYDTEASPAWGAGAPQPPLCHSVGVIIDRPNSKQKVRCYRIASDFAEDQPGGVSTIPAGMVRGVPRRVGYIEIVYRSRKEAGADA